MPAARPATPATLGTGEDGPQDGKGGAGRCGTQGTVKEAWQIYIDKQQTTTGSMCVAIEAEQRAKNLGWVFIIAAGCPECEKVWANRNVVTS